MEVKKIVEGMTAVEVAEVIDSNFKGLNEGKADKSETIGKISDLESDMGLMYAISNNSASMFSKNERYTKGTNVLVSGGSYNTTGFINIDLLRGLTISYQFPKDASVNAVTVFSEEYQFLGNIQDVSLLEFDSVIELYPSVKYVRLSCKPEDFYSLKIHQSNVELKKDLDKISSKVENYTTEIILNKTYYPETELYNYDGRFVLAGYIPIFGKTEIVASNGVANLTTVVRYVDKDLNYLGTEYSEDAKYVKVAVVVKDYKELKEEDLVGFTITINEKNYRIIGTSLFYELSLEYKERDSVNALLSSNPLNAFIEERTYYKVSDGTKAVGTSYDSTKLLPIDRLLGLQLSYEHPAGSSSNKISVFDVKRGYLGSSEKVDIIEILDEYPSAYYVAFTLAKSRRYTLKGWYSKFPQIYDEGVGKTFGNESFVQGGLSNGLSIDSEYRIRINKAIYVGVGSRVLVNVASGYECVVHFMNSETEYGGSFREWGNSHDFLSSHPYIKIAIKKSGNTDSIITPSENVSLTLKTFRKVLDDLVGKEEFEERLNSVTVESKTPSVLAAKIFRRVGCIGDSYTAGYIKLTDEGLPNNTYPLWSWVHYMKNLTGENWENWGKGGSTAKSWIEGYANLHQVTADGNRCQAYVIGLVINDQNSGNPYYTPVGSVSDIGTDNNTYYAYYYKLIKRCVVVNPAAKIFCNTCPKSGSSYETYNQAVRDIVSYCYNTEGLNVYLCDLASEKYMTEEYYGNPVFENDYIQGHYSPICYEFMAECFLKVMSNVIMEHLKDFQNVFLVPYDEAVSE